MTESEEALMVQDHGYIEKSSELQKIQKEFDYFFKNHLKLGKNGEGDYGLIKGCGDKPALFKPGAEKILAFLGLTWNVECMTERVNPEKGEYYYRYRVTAFNVKGEVVSVSEAVATSLESKYYYVTVKDITKPIFKNREQMLESGELVKLVTGDGGVTWLLAQRKIHDKANTAARIAQKRGLVGCALAALRIASQVFTMDIEDLMDYVKGEDEDSDKTSDKTSGETSETSSGKEKPKETPKTSQKNVTKNKSNDSKKEPNEMSPVNPELNEEEERANAIKNYNLIAKYIEDCGLTDLFKKEVNRPERTINVEPDKWPTDVFKELKQKMVLFFRGAAFSEISQRDQEFNMKRQDFAALKIKEIAALLKKTRLEFPV